MFDISILPVAVQAALAEAGAHRDLLTAGEVAISLAEKGLADAKGHLAEIRQQAADKLQAVVDTLRS